MREAADRREPRACLRFRRRIPQSVPVSYSKCFSSVRPLGLGRLDKRVAESQANVLGRAQLRLGRWSLLHLLKEVHDLPRWCCLVLGCESSRRRILKEHIPTLPVPRMKNGCRRGVRLRRLSECPHLFVQRLGRGAPGGDCLEAILKQSPIISREVDFPVPEYTSFGLPNPQPVLFYMNDLKVRSAAAREERNPGWYRGMNKPYEQHKNAYYKRRPSLLI